MGTSKNKGTEREVTEYLEQRGDIPRSSFYKESKLRKIPLISRYAYVGVEGSGRPISLGLGFSFGLKTGVVVITLPMLEISIGYSNLRFTL